MSAIKKISCRSLPVILLAFCSCLLLMTLMVACSKFSEEHPKVAVTLSTSELKPAPSGFTYEAWVRVDGQAVSLGRFSVDSAGVMAPDSFEVDQHDLMASSNAFVTLEPSSDDPPTPSGYVIMDGAFGGGVAQLSVGGALAFKSDFSRSKASFVLRSPSGGAGTGLWFYNGKTADPKASLLLPKLPPAWVYEAIFEDSRGVTLSLGSFPVAKDEKDTQTDAKKQAETQTAKAAYGDYVSIRGADSENPYSVQPTPAFPGEDFSINAPLGIQFPLDVRGGKLSIVVRDAPGKGARAFSIYQADIPQNAQTNTPYPMRRNTQLPSGQLDRTAAKPLL